MLLNYIVPAGTVCFVSLGFWIYSLYKSLKETKQQLTKLYDIFFAKDVYGKVIGLDGQVLKEEKISSLKEEMGGKLDEAEVVLKRFSQNKLRVHLNLSSKKITELEDKVVIEFKVSPPRK